ncbi:class V lanthionine synthetase subunit LxmK [Streptomyces sp. NPDC014735]|uniref:class V lanthionine synthetase subunit LxmK n=1 Tax=unclassified Streptomyces TaxID=2593676 RepID=UPI0036FBA5FA
MNALPPPARHLPEATYEAVRLDRAPEVDTLLTRLGLGRYDPSTVVALPGRNDTWAGYTTTGAPVFVKRLVGPADDVRERLGRALAYERVSAAAPDGHLRGPRLLGHDAGEGLMAFDYLADARGGAVLVADDGHAPDLARRVGTALGLLHGATAHIGRHLTEDLDRRPPLLPSSALLEGIPLHVYERSSAAELQSWRLLQTDPELITAVDTLLDAERAAPSAPAHCDFRLDQLLVTEGSPPSLVAADWEEFRLADPARDVGSFAGECLHRSVMDIISPRDDDARAGFADLVLSREAVLRRGTEALTRLRPVVRSFWAGYLAARPDADPGLPRRAAAFAGWHALDRLLAGAARRNRLLGIERAAAGVGRAALLEPARFAPVIGLGEMS